MGCSQIIVSRLNFPDLIVVLWLSRSPFLMALAANSFLIMTDSGILVHLSLLWRRRKMALFSVSGKNTNEHGELRHPLVVRNPFLLGTDFTESETSTQPTNIVQVCYVSVMMRNVKDS